jgi:hypothetical protein
MPIDSNTMLAGTLQTDPRSGGLKRSSGVNVHAIVAESEFVVAFVGLRTNICR